jgi:hypothetical protein
MISWCMCFDLSSLIGVHVFATNIYTSEEPGIHQDRYWLVVSFVVMYGDVLPHIGILVVSTDIDTR